MPENDATPPAGDDLDTLPGDDTPPSVERPEWLPEKFWTGEGPNVENLAKSYAELERQRGVSPEQLKEQWQAERLSARPEAADKYELPDIDVLDKDAMAASPIVGMFRTIAYDNGLSQDQFTAAIADYAKGEVERMDAIFREEMGKLGENATARAEAVGLWAKKTFGEGDKFDAIASVTTTAAGVEAMETIMAAMREAGLDLDSSGGTPPKDDEDTEEVIRDLMQQRGYWDPKNPDAALRARVDAFYRRKYSK